MLIQFVQFTLVIQLTFWYIGIAKKQDVFSLKK